MRPRRRDLGRSAVQVAPTLLGAVIESDVAGAGVAIRLTEVEAYAGTDDPASHAFRGRTRRNGVMFGPAGYLYCYFTYGMHWCANVTCGPDGVATAVLLRAGEVVSGHETAYERRPAARRDQDLARGPARLASCLGLASAANGLDLLDAAAPVRLVDVPDPAGGPPRYLRSGPRVGISVAVERPWRFWLADEPTVSVYKPGRRAALPGHRQTDPS